MEKLKIKETVIVEGKYDKIKLDSVIDANIIITEGFGIFKNPEQMKMIRVFAEKNGVIILTDSDSAGKKIRNYLKSCLANGDISIKHIYIPRIEGKEKRKNSPSKENFLGVEGIDAEKIREVFLKFGTHDVCGQQKREENEQSRPITRMDLYNGGFIGQEGSSPRRAKLCEKLGLPPVSSSALLEALNTLVSCDKYLEMIKDIE